MNKVNPTGELHRQTESAGPTEREKVALGGAHAAYDANRNALALGSNVQLRFPNNRPVS